MRHYKVFLYKKTALSSVEGIIDLDLKQEQWAPLWHTAIKYYATPQMQWTIIEQYVFKIQHNKH